MNLLSAATAHEAALIRVPAWLRGDFVEHPMSALLRATPDWLAHLAELRGICASRGLAHLIVDGAPEAWQHEGRDAGLRLGEADLIVTPESFWFRDRLRGQRTTVETVRVDIERFVRLARAAEEEAACA